jgi:hypothetical protein
MISTRQPAFPHWRQPVQVTIRNRNGDLDVVGIDRQTDLADVASSERRARTSMASVARSAAADAEIGK